MEFMEKVEKLRNKANISYEEAKTILTETDGDLLEAMILLEKQGRIDPPSGGTSGGSTRQAPGQNEQQPDGHIGWQGFVAWLKSLIHRGNRNSLQIKRHGEIIAAMPVTVFVAALLFAFWVTLPLLVIGLFCGCSYGFRGPDLEKENINKAWDMASEVAENIKADIQREMDKNEHTNQK